MKRKMMKFLCIIFCILYLLIIFNNFSYAETGKDVVVHFDGSNTGTIDYNSGENIVKKVISTILSTVRIIAVGISIIMITYLGIHYVSAAPQEKASIKNQLITFTVGAAIVFGTVTILEKVQEFATSVTAS